MTAGTIPMPAEYLKLLVAATCHLGGQSLTHKMSEYAFGRRSDKIWVIDLKKTWEKLVLAARIIVSYKNRADIVVVSSKTFGNKPASMFAKKIGATASTGKFVPGSFTNRSTKSVKEPRLLLVTDPFTDRQTLCEASYINVPCIALSNTDNSTNLIDCVIPCNNRSPSSIGAIYFTLERLVRHMSGEGSLDEEIRLKADAYFYRDPAEVEAAAEGGKEEDKDDEGSWEHLENEEEMKQEDESWEE
jgi:small subunit ribosomal protein SAe